ncbi:unnamed protein product [Oikopleura dioica]|uniref:4Fe-4S ferredoxin-type domain-containing protein n=1 Tax=Oikopleura dioica TaxID=34765 RepID=E4Y154_OIKDI|nr:unnamed protein product [Oikopleura dioica]
MRFLLIFSINLAQASSRQRDTCNDQEINNECLVVCDGEFFECTKNCDNSECSRKCFEELDVCENSCPCGADCPTGCVDCPEHPLCEDECEDAQLNNNDYKICLNEAIYELSDVFILAIPRYVEKSYLQSGDGSSQISATINAPRNDYAYYAAYALVNGKLHIFGGWSDVTKIARLDDCTLNELTVRLNEEREAGHAALSIENGKKVLICFGDSGNIRKTCEIFDGSTTVSTFASDWTHRFGGLGLYKNQPRKRFLRLAGLRFQIIQNAFLRTASSLLENQSLLLIGGIDWGNDASQSGIWQLKDENWNQIGDLLQADYDGSAIYIGRLIYYFGPVSKAIQRLDFTETEDLQTVSQIGNQPGSFYLPVLFQTVSNYCV